MKRFFITIIVFVVIFAGLYSGVWFYNANAVKLHTEQAILTLTKDLGGKKSDFIFSDTQISGFPLNYKVQINKPRFILNDQDISVDMSSDEPLIVESDILASSYTATLPQDIIVKNGESLEENYTIRYNGNASINITSDAKGLLQKIKSALSSGGDENFYQVKNAKYIDKGYSYINPINQEIIASSEGQIIEIDLIGRGEYNLKANIADQYFKSFNEISDNGKKIGNLNIDADIIYKEDLGDKLNFNKLVISSDNFSIDVKGHAAGSNIEAFPYGNLEIKVSNYEDFIDFQATVLNDIVKKSGLPVFNLKDKQISRFKDFLGKVATETNNDGQDIVISLKREEGQAINIGKYSFIEAVHLYNGGTIETVTTPASKEFVTEDIIEHE